MQLIDLRPKRVGADLRGVCQLGSNVNPFKSPVGDLNSGWNNLAYTAKNTVGSSFTVDLINDTLYYIGYFRVTMLPNITTDSKILGLTWNTGADGFGAYPSFVYVFGSGIVYVVNSVAENKIKIWKAINFQTMPTIVAELDGNTSRLACNAYSKDGKEYLFVGGYTQIKGTPHTMYFSQNGGNSFSNIKTTSGIAPESNWHWHCASYDPYSELLWIAEGDDINSRGIWYSSDLGTSWDKINSNDYQPTLIVPTKDKVFFGRDYGKPGLDSVIKANLPVNVLEDALTFRTDAQGANYYPSGNYAKIDNEIYISFSITGGSLTENYIYGSGDNGLSWHLLYTNSFAIRDILICQNKIIGISSDEFKIVYHDRVAWI